MTWEQRAAQIIAAATRDLPADTPLKDRQKRVDAARPGWCVASWPRKAWQAARRKHLIPYGYQPRTKSSPEPSLPLFIKHEE